MSEVLIGLASCHEAFVAAPVVRALQASSTSFRVALLGEEAAEVHAGKLGLPQCELTSSGPRTGLAGAAAFERRVGRAEPYVACQREAEREVTEWAVDDGDEQELALLQLGERELPPVERRCRALVRPQRRLAAAQVQSKPCGLDLGHVAQQGLYEPRVCI